MSLGLLYTFQDRMLYAPDMPIRHIKDNPRGYQSPTDRHIKYTQINLDVPGSPGDRIVGWHMYHDNTADQSVEKKHKTPTVLFFHENAGNIGLRMDFFSMLYHDLDFDILAFAYRGYSDSTLASQSFPSESILR